MFVKVTKSGPRKYVQLVEAYRDENGRPKQRTIASLGRLDKLGDELQCVIDGLGRVLGRDPSNPSQVTFESSRTLGNVWALTELWDDLGFDQLRKIFRGTRHSIHVEALIRIMVINRLSDPDSKLGVLRWLETVSLPGLKGIEEIQHQYLLRAMDALSDHQEAVDNMTNSLLRPLVDQDLSVVFYDMTTIKTEGHSKPNNDIRAYGLSKEGGIKQQVMLGMVQTADGLPLYHELFEGNTAEVVTFKPIIEKIIERFPVTRIIVVADRGLLSIDNLDELKGITLPSGQPLEFILAVPGRRYKDFKSLLTPLHNDLLDAAKEEVITETRWQNLRLVVAHDPKTAKTQQLARQEKIETLEKVAEKLTLKLDRQDDGVKKLGRKLSDNGASAKFYKKVCEARLSKVIKVDMKSDLFCYDIDHDALQQACLMDGKLLLVTNVADLSATEAVARYKSLADIERGFRVLKSDIEIGPVYHRLPRRIKAHAMICFIALVIYRVMRMRLKESKSSYSPCRALEKLSRIQHHKATINGKVAEGLSGMTAEQLDIFAALLINKPVSTNDLSTL
ncbi:MAG: transposase [Osedax symbiont Rs1]|nr:MAG: transposase [Osedax symbiont Rs1]